MRDYMVVHNKVGLLNCYLFFHLLCDTSGIFLEPPPEAPLAIVRKCYDELRTAYKLEKDKRVEAQNEIRELEVRYRELKKQLVESHQEILALRASSLRALSDPVIPHDSNDKSPLSSGLWAISARPSLRPTTSDHEVKPLLSNPVLPKFESLSSNNDVNQESVHPEQLEKKNEEATCHQEAAPVLPEPPSTESPQNVISNPPPEIKIESPSTNQEQNDQQPSQSPTEPSAQTDNKNEKAEIKRTLSSSDGQAKAVLRKPRPDMAQGSRPRPFSMLIDRNVPRPQSGDVKSLVDTNIAAISNKMRMTHCIPHKLVPETTALVLPGRCAACEKMVWFRQNQCVKCTGIILSDFRIRILDSLSFADSINH